MKFNKNIFVFFSLILSLVLIPVIEFSILASILVSGYLLIENNEKISKTLFNSLSFLVAIFFIGLIISVFYQENTFYNKFKDLVYFLKPILLLLTGYLVSKNIGNTKKIIKVIIYAAVFIATKHIVTLLFADLSSGTISQIRHNGGYGSFLEIIVITIIFIRKKFPIFNVIKNNLYNNIILLLLSISFILYFSRTMILGLVIFIISAYGFTKLTEKSIRVITIVTISFAIFYASLFTMDLDEEKGFDNFLFKIKNAPIEVFSAPKSYDSRNHRDLFKRWRAYEASMAFKQMEPINYIFGKGFGSLVDLKFKAPIGGENGLRYIPHIHNGYMFVFFKTGILGLFLYLMLLTNFFKKIYIGLKSNSHLAVARFLSGFGLYFFVTSLIITGMYNLQEESTFFLGVFLFLFEKENK